MKPLIQTRRLYLREIILSDTLAMFQLHADPEVQKYTGEPVIKSMEEMEEAIKIRIQNYKKYGYGRWAVFRKDSNEFIGWAGLDYLPEFDEVDLGYRFLQKYWGKGFATEVSQAILSYGFQELGMEKIIAIAMKENKASIKVMEKVGMDFDKFAPYQPGGKDVAWYLCYKNAERFSKI